MSWLFTVSVFGFLWACKKRKAFFADFSWTRFLAQLLCETAELFFQVAVLYIFFRYGLAAVTPAGEMSIAPFFIILGAYLLKLLRRTTDFFLWQTVVIAFLHAEVMEHATLSHFVLDLLGSVFFMGFICLALLGMEKRLLFSRVPIATRGLPLLLMNMVIILLALWGFQGILF